LKELGGAFVNRCAVFGSADEFRDLPHLRDPAVRLRTHRWHGAIKAREEARLTARELGAERVVEAVSLGCREHRRTQGGEALGQPGVRELQARRGADRTVEDRNVETEARQARQQISVAAGCVEARTLGGILSAGGGRAADNAGVDEVRRRVEQIADMAASRGRDRVAFDEDRRLIRAANWTSKTFGNFGGDAGRNDRKHKARAAQQRIVVVGYLQAGAANARDALGAAASD